MRRLREARDIFLSTVAVIVAAQKLDQAIQYFRYRWTPRPEEDPPLRTLIVIERGSRSPG
jgi:hypothetical protein